MMNIGSAYYGAMHETKRWLSWPVASVFGYCTADYNLQLLDAFQVAAALQSKCEAILTNDMQLKRVKELRVLVVSELEIAE